MFYYVQRSPAQHGTRPARLKRTMSLSHLGVFGIARLVLLILGAYTLIEVLLPTVLAGAAGAT